MTIMPREDLRSTGVDVIGHVPWGTHFCQFYDGKEDLIDILVPYFKAGLENNEFCMWVTSEPLDEGEAREALRQAVPDLDRYIATGQLEIVAYDEWYTKGGKFDSPRVLNGWVDKLEQAQAKGFVGLRLTGNTFWLERSDWADFTDYEEAVNDVIGKYRMMAICTYCLGKCGAPEIMDVIRNHQFALLRRHGKWEIVESTERKRLNEALLASAEELAVQAEELRAANDGLMESQRALADSERRYRLLFEQQAEGFAIHEIILDKNGRPCDYRFLDVNPAFERFTGLKRALVVGKTVREALPGIEQHWIDTYGEVALSGKPIRFENYAQPLNRYYEVIAFSPERGQFATLFVDITERKRLFEQLQAKNEELQVQSEEIQAQFEELRVANEDLARATRTAEEALQARDEFLSVAAHELKTPVTSLRGFAQTLLRQYEKRGSVEPERLSRGLQIIDQQSSKLIGLVSQLLDLSRLEGGRLVLQRQHVDLVRLVEEIVDAARLRTDRHTLVVEAPSRVEAFVDPVRIEQVVTNLVDNAIRYSPEGGPIEIVVAARDEEVELAVRDRGIGIPPEHCPHVFERFYRAHEGASVAGLGLGLYVSKEIVTLHDGRIAVECPPDGGTRFVVGLPLGNGASAGHDQATGR